MMRRAARRSCIVTLFIEVRVASRILCRSRLPFLLKQRVHRQRRCRKQPRVHRQGCAGDPAGLVGREKKGGPCYVPRGTLYAQRTSLASQVQHFLGRVAGDHRTVDVAGGSFYTHAVVDVCRKTKVCFSITIRQRASLRNLIEAIPEADWTPIPYWMDGAADVAETTYLPFRSEPDAAPVRLIVRRVKPTPGSHLALFATYSYHGFITDRDGETLELEAGHRRHAEVENAIRDLKYGVGLNHLPPGRFAANAA